jgi:hypothetical protein
MNQHGNTFVRNKEARSYQNQDRDAQILGGSSSSGTAAVAASSPAPSSMAAPRG